VDCRQTQHLLHGYLDGELDLVRSLEIEEHLRGCADCQQVQKSQQALRQAFRAGSLAFRAPAGLEARIRSAVRGAAEPPRVSVRLPHWAWTGIAACVALAAGLACGVFYSRSTESGREPLGQQALASHLRFVLAGRPPDVPSSDQHKVKPWFQDKVPFSPFVKDLAAQGFLLVGGNLDYLDNQRVAALIYRRREHIISLFIWPADSAADTPPVEQERQGYNLISWTRSGMNLWAVSNVNPNDLREFASLVNAGG